MKRLKSRTRMWSLLLLLSCEVGGKLLPTIMAGTYERAAAMDYTTCQSWTDASAELSECASDYILAGVRCGDAECKQLSIRCCQVRGTHDGSITTESKGCNRGIASYVSENAVETEYAMYAASERRLRDGGKVHFFGTGIQCKSNAYSTCAEMKLRGRRLQCTDANYLIEDDWRAGQCQWSDWTSISSTELVCPTNMGITGIDCTGLECSKLRIECCPFGHVCPKGYYGDNVVCHACPIGRYGAVAGLTSAQCSGPCDKGYYALESGLTSATCSAACPRGTYLDTTGGTSSKACLPCPAGVYGNREGLTTSACTAPCPVGTYRPTPGAASVKDCLMCPRDTYSASTGRTTCTQCPSNQYSNKIGATSVDDCKTCPPSYRGNQCVGKVTAVGG